MSEDFYRNQTTTTTVTTTTTTRRQDAPFSLNRDYLTSREGILNIVELVIGLLCWPLITGAWGAAYSFVFFAYMSAWISTLLSLLVRILLDSTFPNMRWIHIDLPFYALWAILYFLGACVNAAHAYDGQRTAAAIFAFINTAVYVVHTLFAFQTWFGRYPWQKARPAHDNVVDQRTVDEREVGIATK